MSEQHARTPGSGARVAGGARVVVAAGASLLLVAVAVTAAVLALADRPAWVGTRDEVGREVRVVAVRPLPQPRLDGRTSVEEAMVERTSVRTFADRPLADAELGQLLWAAQGELAGGGRTVPSAGALYPLELYVVSGDGIGHYRPDLHELAVVDERDLREEVHAAALQQRAFATAPSVVVVAGVEQRMAVKYGSRAQRYVLIEAGHAGQNLLLQASALGLGAVPTGAFDDARIADLVGLPAGVEPLYLIPVGEPA